MSVDITKQAAALAEQWMVGYRRNTTRPAWKHPKDVVGLLREIPGKWSEVSRLPFMEVVAWLHDILEDGVKETGERVCAEDLRAEGVSEDVISAVVWLTILGNEEKTAYLDRLRKAPEPVLVIKALDRIANLREARVTHRHSKWLQSYVSQTEDWILPFVRELPGPHGPWLANRLNKIMIRCTSKLGDKEIER